MMKRNDSKRLAAARVTIAALEEECRIAEDQAPALEKESSHPIEDRCVLKRMLLEQRNRLAAIDPDGYLAFYEPDHLQAGTIIALGHQRPVSIVISTYGRRLVADMVSADERDEVRASYADVSFEDPAAKSSSVTVRMKLDERAELIVGAGTSYWQRLVIKFVPNQDAAARFLADASRSPL